MCSRNLDQMLVAWVFRVFTKPFLPAKIMTLFLVLVWTINLIIAVVEFSSRTKETELFIFSGLSPVSAIVISLAFFTFYLIALLGIIYKRSELLLPARMASLLSSIMGIVMVGFYFDRSLYLQFVWVALVTIVSYLYWFYLLVRITELLEEGEDLPDKLDSSWTHPDLVDRS